MNAPRPPRCTLSLPIFIPGLLFILALLAICSLAPEAAARFFGSGQSWIAQHFSWFYVLVVGMFLILLLVIAFSHFGNIRLGPDDARPEFSFTSWLAMLFAAGMGIGLMYFGVGEPMSHFVSPPQATPLTQVAAREAMVTTFFHWGFHAWAIYAIVGLVLAYFGFRYNLPLTIRSGLYPIFKEKIHGPLGHAVDVFALVGTIFGIATTLGIGVVQLNYGLSVLFDIPDSLAAKAALIALSVIIATISVTSGVDKGIRVLSELNVALALGLILFVLFMGDTSFLLNALVLNVGDYVNRFMGMTLNSFAFDRPVEWMNNWTLFFWAWWVAWSPFVGLFLARISRGRTIRQFVMGTLIIPFTFTLLWLSVFGNSALYEIIHGDAAFAQEAMAHPERGFYSLLAQYPAFTFSASVATITGLLFYVTSADSGALVLGNFTSKLKDINSDAPNWLRIFWSVAIGLLTLGMLMTNGISALQNTTVIMGLPFSFVIFFVMAGLYKSLKVEDYRRVSASRDTAPRPMGLQDRLSWKKRLSRLMNYPGTRYTKLMMETVCYPAMEEVAQELRLRGAAVELKSLPPEEGENLGHLDLLVHMGDEQNFIYKIWPQQYSVPGFTYRARSGKSTYYRLETFLLEGSQGNDLMDYSKEQVITDILDQYERHLNFIHLHREAPGNSVMFPDG